MARKYGMITLATFISNCDLLESDPAEILENLTMFKDLYSAQEGDDSVVTEKAEGEVKAWLGICEAAEKEAASAGKTPGVRGRKAFVTPEEIQAIHNSVLVDAGMTTEFYTGLDKKGKKGVDSVVSAKVQALRSQRVYEAARVTATKAAERANEAAKAASNSQTQSAAAE